MARKTTKPSNPVSSIKHKDKRANIPTKELRDFVRADEEAPKKVFYPRDPSLDPQLVWKGKDEQDSHPLEVPAVPIYIQEKIKPQALIEDLRAISQEGKPQQMQMYADFNGLPGDFEKRVDFYHYEGNWQNRIILGDSLLVMTSLAEKENLKGKVQMIYVDPPYGIKFGSNWQVSTRKRDVKDGRAEDATRQPEQIKAFRDTWELGIHSYLAYLRDRLVTARDLLTESGSVFVQISDENVHLVRCILDEVFGSENFCSQIAFAKTGGQTAELLGTVSDYLLWYAKDREKAKFRRLYFPKNPAFGGTQGYDWVELSDGTRRRLTTEEKAQPSLLSTGPRIFMAADLTSAEARPSTTVSFEFKGSSFHPGNNRHWRVLPDLLRKLADTGRLIALGNTLRFVQYIDDFSVSEHSANWDDTGVAGFAANRIYVVETNTKVVERCVLMTTDPGDLVLDPTCGSGTTEFVAEEWGRRWITCDTSRVALALARTRLMAAKFPYYLLADDSDIKKGFQYKTVPHITLKSIANNPDIREGMTREQIDAAIAKHAESETLYDQPFEDNKRLRVTGPFTVESLSPHRVLSTDEERPAAERATSDSSTFVERILENLKKAGVQNRIKNERLTFDMLDSYAGAYLNASGEYTEGGKSKRVAVCIGPEHGTVGPELVKEAAKEAVQGIGHDLLLVCGFAFDPHVSEETKRYGKLTVLITRMNPDLSMGDELLKKTGAANLFMVFGEPDLEVKKTNGQIAVTLKGVDVYDPTTGQIRSNSTDDIACWFIDTDYNGESFFVRHAYFTGAGEPYERLRKALRAEINEEAWSSLYSTTSRPFDTPKSGKFAVKVINHYGDEVLKVYALSNGRKPR